MNEAEKIAKEMGDLQRLLLPSEFPDVPGYSFAIHYVPCEAAGGDFYGWQKWDDGTLGIGVADVSGHGMRAAVVMAMVRAVDGGIQTSQPPARYHSAGSWRFLCRGEQSPTTFITVVFLRLKPQSGEFTFRNCGHPSPKIRRRDGSVVAIHDGRVLPIGIMFEEADDVAPATGHLAPGEALVLYTDGVPDSGAEDGSFFDDERLDAAISNCAGDAESIVNSIATELLAHRGKRRQRDDECIVVIRRGLIFFR